MALSLITPPPSLADMMLQGVCDHLRQELALGDSPPTAPVDVDYIRALTEAAVSLFDGPRGKLGRCLLTQTWRVTIDHLFPRVIELRIPPLQSVAALRYVDTEGVQRSIDMSLVRLSGAQSGFAEIWPAHGQTWPTARWQAATIEVDVVSGYGDNVGDVPAAVIQAVRLAVGHWYANRAAVERTTFATVPFAVAELLAPYRVFR